MIPDTISDIFQPMNDFFYGLDVEIRPKLTPGAGTPRWALAAIHPRWGNRYSNAALGCRVFWSWTPQELVHHRIQALQCPPEDPGYTEIPPPYWPPFR